MGCSKHIDSEEKKKNTRGFLKLKENQTKERKNAYAKMMIDGWWEQNGMGGGDNGKDAGAFHGCRHMWDRKNEVSCSFCELELSTLTSYWRTTWVDYMNANKIKKEESLVREESLAALEEESN